MDKTKHSRDKSRIKNKNVLKSTNFMPLPCNTVLGITELRELILSFMNSSSSCLKDLKHCALVCRLWQSYFRPYVWKSLTVGRKVKKGRMSFRKETGLLVRRLTITCATRNLVNFIPEFFPHIGYLSLAIGFESDGIGYGHLHRLFTHLQDTLTEVQISLEMSVYQSSTLWSLSSLPRLRRLDIKVLYPTPYAERYSADEVCLEVLGCCAGLEVLQFEFLGRHCFNDRASVYRRVKRWVQWRMDSWSDLAPTPLSPQETLAESSSRNDVGLSQQTLNVQGNSNEPSLSVLRRLYYKEAPSNIGAFVNIITTHGPGLEELAIKGYRHYPFSEHIWRSVLETCRFLRILDIVDRGPCPSIATLISSLLYLEALLINFLNNTPRHVDLGLSELAASFEKHRKQYGREHPLRCLEFGGWIDRPDLVMETLMEVMLQESASSQIEGLRICYGSRCSMTPPMYLSVLSSTAISSSSPSTFSTLDHTTTISTISRRGGLKDTLVQLDLSFEQFPLYSEGKQFFERLQVFCHLRVLHVMHTHLWVLGRMHNENNNHISPYPYNALPHIVNANNPINPNSCSSSTQPHHRHTTTTTTDDEASLFPLPETTLQFPSIQELYIGYGDNRVIFPLNYTPRNAVTLELAVLVIAMMPQLRVFGLGDKATSGVKRMLRERFRGIVFQGDQE
ncbi:hypothetical protein BKA57DRAFT_156942 [Linnemannia elongata]|nr:hypothetical protein BKA57DRAFT_156942 [Linnemannia elongata]